MSRLPVPKGAGFFHGWLSMPASPFGVARAGEFRGEWRVVVYSSVGQETVGLLGRLTPAALGCKAQSDHLTTRENSVRSLAKHRIRQRAFQCLTTWRAEHRTLTFMRELEMQMHPVLNKNGIN